MTRSCSHGIFISVVVSCLLLVLSDYAFGARSGGSSGRSGGGYRSSSVRTSYSTSVRTKVRVSTSVRYGNRYYLVYPSVGVIYGYSAYKTRSVYYHSHNEDPTVCFNDDPVDNGTVIGYFVCPLPEDSDSYSYCCGEDGEQYCCDFWGDSDRTQGAIVGIVLGVCLTTSIVGIITKLYRRKKLMTIRKPVEVMGPTPETVPLAPMSLGTGAGYSTGPASYHTDMSANASQEYPPAGQPYPPAGQPYPPAGQHGFNQTIGFESSGAPAAGVPPPPSYTDIVNR